MTGWTKVMGTGLVVASIAAAGCAVEKGDEAERFREGVPQASELALNVPGAPGGGTTAKSHGGLRIATLGGADRSARYYRFTRDISSAVDTTTAATLGLVWAIVNLPPTSVSAGQAVWGPGQDNALDPVVYRLTAKEITSGEYDYVLEGQPKAGGAFRAVLTGHGYGNARPEHRSGWFQWDADAARELDPARNHDTGTSRVTYDLRGTPGTIDVKLQPGAEKGFANVRVTHDVAGAGNVEITALADIDDAKTTKLEDIHLLSRWTAAGAGRADVVMTNGDLPFKVDATECWSQAFERVYYKDTVDFEPASGTDAACALAPSVKP